MCKYRRRRCTLHTVFILLATLLYVYFFQLYPKPSANLEIPQKLSNSQPAIPKDPADPISWSNMESRQTTANEPFHGPTRQKQKKRMKPEEVVRKKLRDAKLRLGLLRDTVRIAGVLNDTAISRVYYNLSKRVRAPVNRPLLIYGSQICKGRIPDLLIIVPSIPDHFHIRRVIRTTYGSLMEKANNEKAIVRIAFVLGRSLNATIDQFVKGESRERKDIVQVDFIDSYFNLTLKVLHALKWVEQYCTGATYILKADEDTVVNIPALLKNLRTVATVPAEEQRAVYGYVYRNRSTRVVFTEGKWAVSTSEYPMTFYPPYAQGPAYVLTGNLVSKIVNASQYLPYLHIEDVFITGIIAGKIFEAKLITLYSDCSWPFGTPDPCEFVKRRRVCRTNFTPELIVKTLEATESYNSVCGKEKRMPN